MIVIELFKTIQQEIRLGSVEISYLMAMNYILLQLFQMMISYVHKLISFVLQK